MPPKFRGANFMRPKPPKIQEKDRVKNWKIFVGDKVEVIGGMKDVGVQGKVVEVLKDLNAVIVEGVNLGFKHIKPSPEYPKGQRIRKEMHVSYTNVQLVDPASGLPTKTRLIKPRPASKHINPITMRHDVQRLAIDTQTLIPIPEPKDDFEAKAIGPLDTDAEVVRRVTFQPSIAQCPFPNAFMNELERLRRKNKESVAF
ncbi:Plastid ribosomal protein L24 [Thoreauomyces humboldtii]|nr:Plastid ribosomal protein L24 [Thoreauomyces humboldtii]